MKFMKKTAGAAALVSLFTAVSVAAETVTMLHNQNQPRQQELWDEFAAEFESANPGVTIEFEFMENEQMKAKLPTLLQSKSRPNIFYSWGGGNFADRADNGLLDDISGKSGALENILSEGSLKAFTHNGKIYGVPYTLASTLR